MQTDPWPEIESAALGAFGTSVNLNAPALVSVIRRSALYANTDDSARQIVVDRRAFFFAVIAVGISETPSATYGNTATWFANWLRAKRGLNLERVLNELTGSDKVLDAFNRKYNVIASGSVKNALALAVEYATRTVSRPVVDLRHLCAALLNDVAHAGLAEFADLPWKPTDADVAALRRELFGRIASNPETNENVSAWGDILLRGLPPPRTLSVAGFTSDRPPQSLDASGDALGIEPDVRAFARLICLEEATPPLSIGLFGGWGSGKSTFMLRLEAAIDVIAATEAERRRQEQGQRGPVAISEPAALRFISRVVQIRFNAWHFGDANLWASLTAEFFDQLRSGGFARQGAEIHSRLVERVNAYVHSLSLALAASREALAEGERKLLEAQNARDKAVKAAEEAQGETVSQTLVDAITTAYARHKTDLIEIGQAGSTKGIDDFMKVAKDVQTLGGQLKTIGKVVWGRGWRTTMLLAGMMLVLIALALFSVEPRTASSLLVALGRLASAAAALAPAVRIVGGIIASTAKFADKLEEVSGERLKKVLAKETELSAAANEAKARREAADRAAYALGRYIDPKGAANPPRLLRFVLEDDPDTKALEKEIGIISRARRLFQAVDEIVKQERRMRAIGGSGDADVPDRIILYIDDLDRCTHDQVYQVLQAIHMLLAFELFVVVVGVDVNWIQEALESQAIGSNDEDRRLSSDLTEKIDRKRRKRAIAYLEKIFQLPFWLQPLTVEGVGGGSYAGYVRQLLAAKTPDHRVRVAPEGVDGARHPQETTPTQGLAPESFAAPHGARGPEIAHANGEETVGLEQALSTIKLTAEEVDFLASPEIGRLAAKEPRSVKRLVNVYRIVRARMGEAAVSALLGQDGRAPSYSLLAILVAIETGQPLEVAESFYQGLRQMKPDAVVDPDSILAELRSGVDPAVAIGWQLIAAALTTAREHRGGKSISAGECLALARDVRCYSFNHSR